MKFIIDSSSLLALVKYYIGHDNKSVLFDFIKERIENGDIIIIDKVYDEIRQVSKGLVVAKLPYLLDDDFKKEFKVPCKTDGIIVPKPAKFANQLNMFFNADVLKAKPLTPEQKEAFKKKYLEDADGRLIMLGLVIGEKEEVCIVTEESQIANDRKPFKKIPLICDMLVIKNCGIPGLIEYYNIEVTFNNISK